MKKSLLFFLLLWGLSFGAPVGNLASPAILQEGFFIPDGVWCQPRVSVLEDFTNQRALVCSSGSLNVHKVVATGMAELGSAIWSIRERFDLSITLGSGQNRIRLYQGNQLIECRPSGGLIWYGEAKLIVLEILDTILGGFGEAGGWDWMEGPAYANDHPLRNGSSLKMRFWQFGMALTQRIGLFSPYGGAAVERSRWKLSSASFLKSYGFHQKYTVGPFLGCSLSPTSKISLNAEWRGWIENSWTVSGEARF